MFVSVVDTATLSTIGNMGLEVETTPVDTILDRIQELVLKKTNCIAERMRLHKRRQRPNETLNEWLIDLRHLLKTCQYPPPGTLPADFSLADFILKHIIVGQAHNDKIQDKLLELPKEASLAEVMALGNQVEERIMGRQQLQREGRGDTGSSSIQAVSSYKREKKGKHGKPQANPPTTAGSSTAKPTNGNANSNAKPKCYNCGRDPQGTFPDHKAVCPAKGNTCRHCSKIGHFDRCCTKGVTLKSIRMSAVRGPDDDGAAPTVTVDVACNSCHLDGIEVLADSGAEVCAASVAFAESLDYLVEELEPTEEEATAFDGSITSPIGILRDVKVTYGSKTITRAFRIFRGTFPHPILSWKAALDAGILSVNPAEPDDRGVVTDLGKVVDRAGGTKARNRKKTGHQSKDKVGGPPTTDILKCNTAEEVIQHYTSVFKNPIGIMKGREMRVTLTDAAVPFACYNPRKIAIPLEEAAKRELDAQVDQGIIERISHATEWVSPLVVAPKKNGDARVCVDLSKLNHYVERTGHAVKTPREVAASIPQGMGYFCVVDMRKGYHQIRLEESSRDFTAFLTPWGKFRYATAPQGLLTSGDEFNLRMDEILAGLEGIYGRIVDDVLTWGKTKEEAKSNLGKILDRCVEWGAAVCPKKLQFCREEVDFAGLRITSTGYTVSSTLFNGVQDFPVPKNRTDVRSYFGLANQLDSTMEALGHLAVLKPLVSEKNAWVWGADQQAAFDKSKTVLCVAVSRAFYNPRFRTRLLTDASTTGLGFVLQQREYKGPPITHTDVSSERFDSREDDPTYWRTVQLGSRHLTDTEKRYAVIEWELLGIAWALKKCRVFVTGIPIEVITDHAPLVPIINRHRLDEIDNTRIQRLRLKVDAYSVFARWKKGATNYAPDSLSRYPTSMGTKDDELAETYDDDDTDRVTIRAIRAITSGEADRLSTDEIRKAMGDDPTLMKITGFVKNGFPPKSSLHGEERKYWSIQDSLSIDDNVLLTGVRIVVPKPLRFEVLRRLHDGHAGVEATSTRARDTLYWPGITSDIDAYVKACGFCQGRQPRNPDPPVTLKTRPARNFQEISTDLCEVNGHEYLIVVDNKSDWLEVEAMGKSTTAFKVVTALQALFTRFGAPETLWSDNGPQYASREFANFLGEWDVVHKTSAPHHPRSNGKAESAVKVAKKLLLGASQGRVVPDPLKLARSLVAQRNTPSKRDGLTPAFKVFGSNLRDRLPTHPLALDKFVDAEDIAAKSLVRDKSLIESADKRAVILGCMEKGQRVLVYNERTGKWNTKATVVRKTASGSYMVKSGDKVYRRARIHLRVRYPPQVGTGSESSARAAPRANDNHNTHVNPEDNDTFKGSKAKAPQVPPADTLTAPRRSTRPSVKPKRLIDEVKAPKPRGKR